MVVKKIEERGIDYVIPAERYYQKFLEGDNRILICDYTNDEVVHDVSISDNTFFCISDGEGIWCTSSSSVIYKKHNEGEIETISENENAGYRFVSPGVLLSEINEFEDSTESFVTLSDIKNGEIFFENTKVSNDLGIEIVSGHLFLYDFEEVTLQNIDNDTGGINWIYRCAHNEKYDRMRIQINNNRVYLDVIVNPQDFFNSEYYLVCIDFLTGHELWREKDLERSIFDPITGNLYRVGKFSGDYDFVEISGETGEIIRKSNIGVEDKQIRLGQGDQVIDKGFLYFVSVDSLQSVGRVNINTHKLVDVLPVVCENNMVMGQRAEIINVSDESLRVWCTNKIFQTYQF